MAFAYRSLLPVLAHTCSEYCQLHVLHAWSACHVFATYILCCLCCLLLVLPCCVCWMLHVCCLLPVLPSDCAAVLSTTCAAVQYLKPTTCTICILISCYNFLPPSPLSKASSLLQALHFCWQVFCMYCLHSMCIACLMDVLPAQRAGMHILVMRVKCSTHSDFCMPPLTCFDFHIQYHFCCPL